jgi:hypothetical protein
MNKTGICRDFLQSTPLSTDVEEYLSVVASGNARNL